MLPANNHRIYWRSPYLLIILGAAGAFVMYYFWVVLHINPGRIRFLFDANDLNVYFKSSRWVVGQGILYKGVFSEYPLLANLIFGFVRYLSEIIHPFPSSFDSFAWVWMSLAWFIYLGIIYQVATKISKQALWIWFAPAPLYFALLRFDIYPALMTLLALFAIRSQKYMWGAFWLGLAIALKGYALVLVPAFFVFLYYRKGFLAAVKITTVCLTGFILSQVAVFAYAGLDGVKQPYLYHINRSTNNESTYDAVAYLLLPFIHNFSTLAKGLQIATSLLAAVFKPKTFEDLVHSFLFAILGFISFSIFHSPQFVLWIVPIACFSPSRWLKLWAIVYSWVMYLYFPVVYDRYHYPRFAFKLTVILMTSVRLVMLYLSFRELQGKAGLKYRSASK